MNSATVFFALAAIVAGTNAVGSVAVLSPIGVPLAVAAPGLLGGQIVIGSRLALAPNAAAAAAQIAAINGAVSNAAIANINAANNFATRRANEIVAAQNAGAQDAAAQVSAQVSLGAFAVGQARIEAQAAAQKKPAYVSRRT